MKVSVIIPVYNHARYLRQRIDSILFQTYKDFELIILDDGSSDNSQEIILEYANKYPGIITFFNENNTGNPFTQWNKGVQLSTGEFIWIAESDDFADIHFLETTVKEIDKPGSIGLVYTDTWVIDEVRRIKYRFSDRERKAEIALKKVTAKSIFKNSIPNVSSILFRREAYIEAGRADESMKYCADWFLSVKIASSWEVTYLPEALSTYRLHKSSSYNQHYRNNRIIREKWSVCVYVMNNFRFSFNTYFLTGRCMIKVIILRVMNILMLPSFLMPEVPRKPKRFSAYS